jgi:hypothetical protein
VSPLNQTKSKSEITFLQRSKRQADVWVALGNATPSLWFWLDLVRGGKQQGEE